MAKKKKARIIKAIRLAGARLEANNARLRAASDPAASFSKAVHIAAAKYAKDAKAR